MKKWTFKVVIAEGNDEFWESDRSYEDVAKVLTDALEECAVTYESVTLVEFTHTDINVGSYVPE